MDKKSSKLTGELLKYSGEDQKEITNMMLRMKSIKRKIFYSYCLRNV